MENWIFITILGAILGAANSNTIVYPGKSALLSYSPARGEFPVESLFGRGYFSYIDDNGISRTVSLEPNPLLGVRVSGNDGKLSANLGNSVELRNDGRLSLQKGDRLKPIKEFDERPFQHNLDEKDMSFLGPSILDSSIKVVLGSKQSKEDQKKLPITIPNQQEQMSMFSKAITTPIQGAVVQPGSTYLPPQSNPMMFFNQPIAPRPSAVQGVFYPQNPFLNQQLGLPVQQSLTPLSGQVFFIPSTGQINSGAVQTSSGLAPQGSTDQFLLFPQKPTDGIVPASNKLPEIKPELVFTPITQMQAISPQGASSLSGNLPSISSGTITPQDSQGQVFINPAPISLTSSSLPSTEAIISDGSISSQQAPNQVPSVPVNSATSTVSNIPTAEGPLLFKPQGIASKPLTPLANLPGFIPENVLVPAASSQQTPNQVPPAPGTSATSTLSNIPGSEATLFSKPQGIASKPLPPTTNFPGHLPGNPFFPSGSSQQAPNQIPSVPITSLPSTVSKIPGSETPLLSKPQGITSKPLSPTTNIPAHLPGNQFFPPSSTPTKYPITTPKEEVFMIKPGNPFLWFNNYKDKPLSRPTPTTTTAAPVFNVDNKNPFLSNLKPNVKLEAPTALAQPIASALPYPQLVPAIPSPQLVPAKLPASTSCKHHSVGLAPGQIKDTPEVEQAKRDHFRAHELALAQLSQANLPQARQNNDNTNQADESSLLLTSTAENSLLYLPPNAPLDQLVTSGPTMTFEQTTVKAAAESEIATLQALPV